MLALVNRNLKIFFKDKAILLFSLVGILIVLGLYVLFLGNVTFEEFENIPGTNFLIATWVMSSIIAMIPINSSLGSLTTMLVDKEKGTYDDLILTSISRTQIIGGYVLSTFIVTFSLSIIALIFTEVYIGIIGGPLLSLQGVGEIILLIVLNTLIATLTLFCVSLFFKNLNAYSLFNSILATLIGFLTGTLVIIGELPAAFQVAVKIFPFSHSASLFRKIMMEEPIRIVFLGADSSVINNFRKIMGIDFYMNGEPISPYISILYLAIFGLMSFIVSYVSLQKKQG
jgi:multidrug/hemolysin transport system permease protein